MKDMNQVSEKLTGSINDVSQKLDTTDAESRKEFDAIKNEAKKSSDELQQTREFLEEIRANSKGVLARLTDQLDQLDQERQSHLMQIAQLSNDKSELQNAVKTLNDQVQYLYDQIQEVQRPKGMSGLFSKLFKSKKLPAPTPFDQVDHEEQT